MGKVSHKERYDALVANADRAAEKAASEIESLKNQLRWANENLAALTLKVDIALGILGGKKEGE